MNGHDAVRVALRARLDQLVKRVEAIDSDLRRTGDRDWEEQALERENDEVLESLDVSSREEVAGILAALGRIRDGRYGTCTKCGGEVGAARLVAMPAAATCAACAV